MLPPAAAVDALTDPTDWTTTRLPTLQRLDNSLRCQVCKEFLNAPLITECSHTFCSLCIRRCLTQDQKCPSCRKPEQEARLRRNAGVEECVEAFLALRGELLGIVRVRPGGAGAAGSITKKGGEEEEEEDRDGGRSPKRQRLGRGRRRRRGASYADAELLDDADWLLEGTEDEMDSEENPFAPSAPPRPRPPSPVEVDDGLTPCPVCQTRMKAERIPYHIEACLSQPPQTQPQPKPQRQLQPQPATPLTRQTRSTRSSGQLPSYAPASTSRTPQPPQPPSERLPKLNYPLLKDRQFREKLLELGIPSHGSKPQMQARHLEWVNLYNANRDSLRPKTKRELVAELAAWERTMGRGVGGGGGGGGAQGQGGGERRPTRLPGWSDEGWAREHGGMFEDLVRRAKEGAGKGEGKGKGAEDGEGVEGGGGGMDENATEEEDGDGDGGGHEDTHRPGEPPHQQLPIPPSIPAVPAVQNISSSPSLPFIPSPHIPTPTPTPTPITHTTQTLPTPDLHPPSSSSSTSLPQQISTLDIHHQEEQDPYAAPQSSQNGRYIPPGILPPEQHQYQHQQQYQQKHQQQHQQHHQPLYPYFHSSAAVAGTGTVTAAGAGRVGAGAAGNKPRGMGKRTRSQMEIEVEAEGGAGEGR